MNPAKQAAGSSFEEIRSLVYAAPSPADLPEYEGASDWETFQAIILSIVSTRIDASMRRTLASSSDYKDAAVKLFHPKGVCAEGEWEVTQPSPYTGLFAEGTRVPSIVRMSASGNNTRYTTPVPLLPLFLQRPRSFGLAVKLFPAADRRHPVRTCNVLLFDQTGIDGNPSPWYMRGAPRHGGGFEEQYFFNWLTGAGPITSGFAKLFAKFANDPRYRRIDALARVDSEGRVVKDHRAPRFVKLIPVARFQEAEEANRWVDFRQELLDLARLARLAFDIAVSENNPAEERSQDTERRIGRLTLGTPVVSEFGDQQLHFSHNTDD